MGFSDYSINLGGALICGYTGVGPDAIVNRSAVKSSTRGEEVALDVLAAAQPKKLYILLGTNTLTTLGAADRFLAYYGQMLDLLRQTLGDDCVIYVQSIPPVRPAAAAEKPGLASDVLRSVNEQLALLAADKGCVYLDLWETFADGEGSLKEVLAAPDGVHFSAGNGYGAWVTYLRNHAQVFGRQRLDPGQRLRGKLSTKRNGTPSGMPFLFCVLLIQPRTPGRPGGVRAAGLRRRWNRRRSGRCLPIRPRRRGL